MINILCDALEYHILCAVDMSGGAGEKLSGEGRGRSAGGQRICGDSASVGVPGGCNIT